MQSRADQFRTWYEYERDCNAKALAMLESVPADRRGAAEFQKAVDRLAHLVAARLRWLHRLGHWPQLVAGLGGNAVDTDYIFWCKLKPIDPAGS